LVTGWCVEFAVFALFAVFATIPPLRAADNAALRLIS
jgi:hypothetical protein